MNKSFIKTLCSALILSIFSTPLFSCHFEDFKQWSSNPCVEIHNANETKFIVFCSDATIECDRFNRFIPHPCKSIGSYFIDEFIDSYGVPYKGVSFNYFKKVYGQIEEVVYSMQNTTGGYGNTPPRNFYRPPVIDYSKIECEGFLAQTSVKINIGEQKPLEFIQPGDTVWSFDLEEKKWKETLVIKVSKEQRYCSLVKIYIDGQCICAAQDQKFYLPNSNTWACAKELQENDLLLTRIPGEENSFEKTPIDKVEVEPAKNQETILLSLEKFQNFCIDGNVLVHNCSWEVINGKAVPFFCKDITITMGKRWIDNNKNHVEIGFQNKPSKDIDLSTIDLQFDKLKKCDARAEDTEHIVKKHACKNASFAGGEIFYFKGYSGQRIVDMAPLNPLPLNLLPIEYRTDLAAPPIKFKYTEDLKIKTSNNPQAYQLELRKQQDRQSARDLINRMINRQQEFANLRMQNRYREHMKYIQKSWEPYLDQFIKLNQSEIDLVRKQEADAQAQYDLMISEAPRRFQELVDQANQASANVKRKNIIWNELDQELGSFKTKEDQFWRRVWINKDDDSVHCVLLKGKMCDGCFFPDGEQTLFSNLEKNIQRANLSPEILAQDADQQIPYALLAATLATSLGLGSLASGYSLLQTCGVLLASGLVANGIVSSDFFSNSDQPVFGQICQHFQLGVVNLNDCTKVLCQSIPEFPILEKVMNNLGKQLVTLRSPVVTNFLQNCLIPILLFATITGVVVATCETGVALSTILAEGPVFQSLYHWSAESFIRLKEFIKSPEQLLTNNGPVERVNLTSFKEAKEVIKPRVDITKNSNSGSYGSNKTNSSSPGMQTPRISISASDYQSAVKNGDIEKFMPKNGAIINGREYSGHALERMAPDTPAVRAELNNRWPDYKQRIKLKPGETYEQKYQEYMNPRSISPETVDRTIKSVEGKSNGTSTVMHRGETIDVIVNDKKKVITVWHKK